MGGSIRCCSSGSHRRSHSRASRIAGARSSLTGLMRRSSAHRLVSTHEVGNHPLDTCAANHRSATSVDAIRVVAALACDVPPSNGRPSWEHESSTRASQDLRARRHGSNGDRLRVRSCPPGACLRASWLRNRQIAGVQTPLSALGRSNVGPPRAGFFDFLGHSRRRALVPIGTTCRSGLSVVSAASEPRSRRSRPRCARCC